MVLCNRLFGYAFLIGGLASIFLQSSLAQDPMAASANVEARRQQLLSLFNEVWEYELRTNPEWATTLGDRRYNERLSHNSANFSQPDLHQTRKFLARSQPTNPPRPPPPHGRP